MKMQIFVCCTCLNFENCSFSVANTLIVPDLATKFWVVLLLFGLLVPRNELEQLQMAVFGKISPLAYNQEI